MFANYPFSFSHSACAKHKRHHCSSSQLQGQRHPIDADWCRSLCTNSPGCSRSAESNRPTNQFQTKRITAKSRLYKTCFSMFELCIGNAVVGWFKKLGAKSADHPRNCLRPEPGHGVRFSRIPSVLACCNPTSLARSTVHWRGFRMAISTHPSTHSSTYRIYRILDFKIHIVMPCFYTP